VRTAAVKPRRVSSRNRTSASASASPSFGLKGWRLSPVWSITIWIAIIVLPKWPTGSNGLTLHFHNPA
jgi:hypothetical protein